MNRTRKLAAIRLLCAAALAAPAMPIRAFAAQASSPVEIPLTLPTITLGAPAALPAPILAAPTLSGSAAVLPGAQPVQAPTAMAALVSGSAAQASASKPAAKSGDLRAAGRAFFD